MLINNILPMHIFLIGKVRMDKIKNKRRPAVFCNLLW